jgi:hypothetical protein
MTRQNENLALERHLVVVFDICSSTSILEDLKQTDHLREWRDVLIGLKNFLVGEFAPPLLQPYKFIGDGWILFLPPDISRVQLFEFLRDLSRVYDMLFDGQIRPLLQHIPSPVGLTFGVDSGELVKLEMNEQVEFLGRALNVASRLQGATKELAGDVAYKALFSKHAYNSLPPEAPVIPTLRAREVRLSLKNLSNNVECDLIEYQVL